MESFLKNYYPKKLSIDEMWQLYKILGKGMGEKYLLDEAVEMMKKLSPDIISKALHLMYDTVSSNPMQLALMFVRGLQHNKFFEFQEFIGTLNGSSS